MRTMRTYAHHARLSTAGPLVRSVHTGEHRRPARTPRRQAGDVVPSDAPGLAPPALDVPLALGRARKEAGLSQRRLATRAGVSASAVGAYEAGTRRASVQVLDRLLAECGLRLAVADGKVKPVVGLLPVGRRGRGFRRYPAHLVLRRVDGFGSWWGDRWGDYWGRPPRPDWTYDLSRSSYDAIVDEVSARLQRVAAYGVITDSRGRLLLTRLNDRTERPGCWTLPGGGVDHGEHPEQVMVREVLEETGLLVRPGDLLGSPPSAGSSPTEAARLASTTSRSTTAPSPSTSRRRWWTSGTARRTGRAGSRPTSWTRSTSWTS